MGKNSLAYEGGYGSVELSGTESSAVGDEFVAVHAWEETTLAFDIILNPGAGANAETSKSGFVIPAGDTWYGRCHNLVLASGRCENYYG